MTVTAAARKLLATSAVVFAAVADAPAGGADREVGDWFRINAPEAVHWRTSAPEDPRRVRVTPEHDAGQAVELLVLYPKRSSAYDTAFTVLLGVLRRQGFAPRLRVVNFDADGTHATAALRRAEDRRVDLVIAMGSQSAAYLHETYSGGALPAVTVCAKDPVLRGQVPSYQAGGSANIAYTSLNLPTEVLLRELTTLIPRLSHLAILVNRRNESAMETQAKPVARLARDAGINARIVGIDGKSGAAAQLAEEMTAARDWMTAGTVGDDGAAARGLFLITGSTSVFRELETIDAYAGDVPVVSMIPDTVRAGETSAGVAIGVGFESNARLAGHYAGQLLRGEASPAELPVGIVEPPDIALNFAKTRGIGLRVPFTFVERASTVYDPNGAPVTIRAVSQPANDGAS